jgi:hypothetical protein
MSAAQLARIKLQEDLQARAPYVIVGNPLQGERLKWMVPVCKRNRLSTIKEAIMTATSDRDPRHHTQKIKKALTEIQNHLRNDITKVDEPQLKAMFETAAEVLGGLLKAFSDYEKKNEAAWRKAS